MEKQKTRIKISSDADLVTVAPFLLGYHIKNSLVFITLHDNRSPGGFRIKLSNTDLPQTQIKDITQTAISVLTSIRGVDSVALITYSDSVSSNDVPYEDLNKYLLSALKEISINVITSLCVSDSYWLNYQNPDEKFNLSSTLNNKLLKLCQAQVGTGILNIDCPTSQISSCVNNESSTHFTNKTMLTEADWFNEMMEILLPEPIWQNISKNTKEKHKHSVYSHLMTSNGALINATQREYATLKLALKSSNFRCTSAHYRAKQRKYANLCRDTKTQEQKRMIASLRALSWWAAGMNGIAREILSVIPVSKNLAEFCPVRVVKILFQEQPLPEYFTQSNWLQEMTA